MHLLQAVELILPPFLRIRPLHTENVSWPTAMPSHNKFLLLRLIISMFSVPPVY
jgi:hypothetical protein